MKGLLFALGTCHVVAFSALGGLKESFAHPPKDCRPETWLQVSGGNASEEGMTRDLEAIAAAGFQGVQLFHEGFGGAKSWPGTTKQISCMGPGWDEFIAHTAKECRRLGLRFMMHLCPGWSMAGGPWVPADKTMRQIVVSRTEVSGAGKVRLPRAAQADDQPWRDYRDTAVVAFPVPEGDIFDPLVPVAVKGTAPTMDARLVRNYYSDPVISLPPDDAETSAANWRRAAQTFEEGAFAFTNENGVAEAELDFGRDVTVRTLELAPVESFCHFWSFQPDVTVRVSAEIGTGWREISCREMPQASWQDNKPISLALPKTTARRFKVAFHHAHNMKLHYFRFYSGARPDNWESEAGRTLRALMPETEVCNEANAFVDPKTIINLTDRMAPDGSLDWIPPAGRWAILRIGNVNAGIRNHPAPPEATGWECDKLSKSGADVHYDGFIGRLTSANGPLAGGLLGGVLLDSWEAEAQTWTPGLDRTFAACWGYGLDAWWPTLVGYVVKDRKATTAFYRDWRELLGDLVFDNFYGHIAHRVKDDGMFVTFQTCGCDVMPADPMKHWKHADEPMCEFWRPRTKFGGVGSLDYKSIRPCVSAARVYGKRRVSAESLTTTYPDWTDEYLRAWKADLDYYFALGVTHTVFENYTHNPQVGFLPPGAAYAAILSTKLLRGQTWWHQMPAFTEYLSRCTYLLEQGKSTSDILLYLGDRIDHKPPHHLPFPRGLTYDYLNKDAFLSRIEVQNGLWTTPEGVTWKALWLYDPKNLRPETAAKLAACEKKGGKVIRGDVFSGASALGLEPQVVAPENLLWQHRTTDAEEIYFFATEHGEPFEGTVRLLGTGEAFLANPVSGEIGPCEEVAFADGWANVKLSLPRSGARFVVIRRGAPVVRRAPVRRVDEIPLSGTWTLSFTKGWGRDEAVRTDHLVSWTELPGTEEQKSYSGTVSYSLAFDGTDAVRRGGSLHLSLGEVETSAEVWLNGERIGLAWTWPYDFNVTDKVKPGCNELRVDVTGSWHNRLRYDVRQPEKDRKTWTLGWPDPVKEPLQTSGLLGPVRLISIVK